MFKKIFFTAMLMCFLLLCVIFAKTTPQTAGPYLMLLVFFCIYICSVGLFLLVINAIKKIMSFFLRLISKNRPIDNIKDNKKIYYYSSILGFIPVFLLSFKSIGTISIYEIILILIFVILGCTYIAKNN